MQKNSTYQLQRVNNTLIFRTSSFKAEKTSVLHSGVYTREFASMMLASGLCITTYMVFDFLSTVTAIVRYMTLILIFVAVFLGANKFIFKEHYLEAVFSRPDKMITIIRSGLLFKKSEKIPFSNVQSVDAGSTQYVPENLDGIDFVQKISAQHGSAVPGLSETEEFVTLSLRLTDGSEIILYAAKIHSGKVDGEPDIPLTEIKNFLEV